MPISVKNDRTMIFTHNIIVLLLFFVLNTWANSEEDFDYSDLIEYLDYTDEVKESDNNNVHFTSLKNNLFGLEKVSIQLYYECLCSYCITFQVNKLAPLIEIMSPYLDIQTYPFGNAKIIDDDDDDDDDEFKCQHGPAECYGNKLHACALDKLQHTTALMYNICLMNRTDGSKSDDESAERCGRSMNVDSGQIKECAKGAEGLELLRYYGEESNKANFSYVPYVLINGKVFDGDDFKKAVCDAFSKPPPACK